MRGDKEDCITINGLYAVNFVNGPHYCTSYSTT